MAMSFTDRVRNFWWTAQEKGRAALVEKIEALQAVVDGFDEDGQVIGTGSEGSSLSLLRTRPEVAEERLLAAREALQLFDDGQRPGAGGRSVIVDRSQHWSRG